jgi:hypothetical protein
MVNKTWAANLVTFGTTILQKEIETPDATLLQDLANQWVDEINTLVKQVYRSWDNAVSTGTVVLTSNVAALPADLMTITCVKWNGVELDVDSEAQLDLEDDNWRVTSGTPTKYVRVGNSIILDFIPSGTTAGMLKIWGYGVLPYFYDTTGTENDTDPLPLIPLPFQMIPIYYALANYPVDPDSKMGMARMARYEARYERMQAACINVLNARGKEPFSF